MQRVNYFKKDAPIKRWEALLFDVIILMMLGVCIYFLFTVIYKLNTDGGKCISNPLEYYGTLGKDKCVSCLSGSYYFKNESKPIATLTESNDSDAQLKDNGLGLKPVPI